MQSSFIAANAKTDLVEEVDIYSIPVLWSIVMTTLKWELTAIWTKRRDARFSRQISSVTQKKSLARMWSLSLGLIFAYLLPSKNFYSDIFSNLLGPLYANQSGPPNINMYLSSEKYAIDFVSLFSLNFRANILFLSSTSRGNNTKRENNFNCFKLSI